MNRRQFLATSLTAASAATLGFRLDAADASDFAFEPDRNIIPAPKDPAHWPEFRQRLAEWRRTRRDQLAYQDTLYRRADFAWVNANFSCCFLMLCDETFYNPKTGRYTVSAFLERERHAFGGYDSIKSIAGLWTTRRSCTPPG